MSKEAGSTEFNCYEFEEFGIRCFILQWNDGNMTYGFGNEPEILFNGTDYLNYINAEGYTKKISLTPRQKHLIDKSNKFIKMMNVLDR